jgi:uncharacterized protein (DUF1778 family)
MIIPTQLTVPLPDGTGNKHYGVKSLRYDTAQRVIFRIRESDRGTIKQAAELLNMSEAQFVRETAVNTARVIIRHMENHNANSSNRSR